MHKINKVKETASMFGRELGWCMNYKAVMMNDFRLLVSIYVLFEM